mgnify:CR=1 FL=1
MTDRVEDIGHDPMFPLFTPAASAPHIRSSSGQNPEVPDHRWYRKDAESFRYQAALYSAGQAFLDLEKSRIMESMITQRDRATTVLLTDSGGYQIGKGTLSGGEVFRNDIHGRNADTIRSKILRWMEEFGDYGMTIDFPTWALGMPNYLFQKTEECLQETLYNLDFITEHRRLGQTKLLNVIQGNDYLQAKRWYDHVKEYPFEGWSFAGYVSRDPNIMVKILLSMWRDGNINAKQRWIHVLGRSSLNAVWNVNIIHRCIREHIFRDAQVSYDTASAVKLGIYGKLITGHRVNRDEIVLEVQEIDQIGRASCRERV